MLRTESLRASETHTPKDSLCQNKKSSGMFKNNPEQISQKDTEKKHFSCIHPSSFIQTILLVQDSNLIGLALADLPLLEYHRQSRIDIFDISLCPEVGESIFSTSIFNYQKMKVFPVYKFYYNNSCLFCKVPFHISLSLHKDYYLLKYTQAKCFIV